MYRCHSVKVLALTIDKNNAYILGIGWLCSLSKNTQLLLHSYVFIFYKYVSCFLKYFSLKKYKTIILTQELSNLNDYRYSVSSEMCVYIELFLSYRFRTWHRCRIRQWIYHGSYYCWINICYKK